MNIEGQNNILVNLKDLLTRIIDLRRYLEYDKKIERLKIIDSELEDPHLWDNPHNAQLISKEKRTIEEILHDIDSIYEEIQDSIEIFYLAQNDEDHKTIKNLNENTNFIKEKIETLEFKRMFHNETDPLNCFLDIQAGAGGTEAQDWASMLLRQYVKYSEKKGFQTELIEESIGDVAGIKSATLKIIGNYAFGYLRTETGIHRLVRKSPFDSSNGRHTSFASIFVYPEIDESFEIEINPSDLRIDTYRASGAGGQHINKTDSAVRITHQPTGIVVQCQSDRSQHRNKAEALQILKSKLYDLEKRNRLNEQQILEDSKTDVGWGHQIRSYVLDQSRIKDLRTNIEVSNTQKVLDGDLDIFINNSLKQGI
ncbi:peptide chain release factor RF-2 [Candidatus Kinetoplastibacterium desouzaii TCC079E]|uniref:Peptide chain release factor 2 n=1 Tax=Candidatus Kinetoplastidibacterium desouzai TCC079E TaxID=1208919 RepID=M1LM66_9PROT|nr:peptide chain release factor 2 [Candidatus Kinetoplastibacterium desouzaii]AGF46812.1 peptide chain release factor RF-2 [Candidatus Kinetoplastibacterium desouzaii TCC079E]